MRRRLRMQRVEETKIIRHRREIRQQIAHHLASLPARFEIPKRLGHIARWPLEGDLGNVIGLFPVLFFQRRLVVKGVHMAHRARTINHQHLLGRHGKMRRPRRVRIVDINRRPDRLLAAEAGGIVRRQQTRQPQSTQRKPGRLHKRSPIQQPAALWRYVVSVHFIRLTRRR